MSTKIPLLVVGLGLLTFRASAGNPPPSNPDEIIEQHVRKLGDAKFRVRNEATDWLKQRPESLPLLLRFQSGADAETKARIESVIEWYFTTEGMDQWKSYSWLASAGRVDLFVEKSVRFTHGRSGNQIFEQYDRMLHRLISMDNKHLLDPEGTPWIRIGISNRSGEWEGSLPPTQKLIRSSDLSWRISTYYLRCGGLESDVVPHPHYQVLSHGNVVFSSYPKAGKMLCSIVAANGDITAQSIFGSVLIAEGNVKCRNVKKSIIIARGTVTITHTCEKSFVRAGKSVYFPWDDPRQRTEHVFSGEKVYGVSPPIRRHRPNIIEDDPAPLGMIRFFSPADVGLEVKMDEKTVVVVSVQKESPLADRIRAGDKILSINNRPFGTLEEFRRTLRTAVVEEGAWFRIQRGKEVTEPLIRIPPRYFAPK